MLKLTEQYHIDTGSSNGNVSETTIGGVYKGFKDVCDLGFGFTRVYALNGEGKSGSENRPNVNITARGGLFGHDFANRLMLEYRDRTRGEDTWRLREKIILFSPFESDDTRGIRSLDRKKLQPYIAEEIFIDLTNEGFNQNRVYFGVRLKFFEHTSTDVHYMLQTLKSDSRWQNNNIIGIDFTISF